MPEYALDADARRVEVRIYGKLLDKNYTDALITRQDLTLEEVIFWTTCKSTGLSLWRRPSGCGPRN
ncbi:MAG: hypothetical protein IPK39_19635 [Sulfuritalea sp.]|nr:hypothetical protein [Sulfuritalea sp.]